MVAELDITDHEVTRIAEMIDGEVAALVPEWKPGPGIEEMPGVPATSFCQNCASNVSSCGSLLDYIPLKTPGCSDVHCSNLECAVMHGRFEELLTCQVEGSEHDVTTEGAPVSSTSQSDGPEGSSQTSRENYSDNEGDQADRSADDERVVTRMNNGSIQQHCPKVPELRFETTPPDVSYDYENEINQGPRWRWLKAKYQARLKEYETLHFGESRRALHPSPDFGSREMRVESGATGSSVLEHSQTSDNKTIKSFHLGTQFSFRIPCGHTTNPPRKEEFSGW